jgi:hypothetical protein
MDKLDFGMFCFCILRATTKIIYDESVLKGDISQIMPSVEIGIDEFNGKSVHWYAGFWSGTEVSIPSGEVELILSLCRVQRGQIVYSGGAFVVKYNFEKGHNYFLMVKHVINNGEVVFTIKAKTAKTKTDVNAKAKKYDI